MHVHGELIILDGFPHINRDYGTKSLFCLKERDRYKGLIAFHRWKLQEVCKEHHTDASKEIVAVEYLSQAQVNKQKCEWRNHAEFIYC